MTINDRLKQAREDRSLSQEQLAELVGVTRGACGQWERGITAPSTENLASTACALGVHFEWLATGRGEMIFGNEQGQNTEISAIDSDIEIDQKELISLFYNLPSKKRSAVLELLRSI
jgi:transcriptional regulator with XRE-family HTH domain